MNALALVLLAFSTGTGPTIPCKYSVRDVGFVEFEDDVHRLGGISTWLLFRCLPALVLAALSILLLASGSARAQSVPGDVEGGQLFFSLEGGEYRPAVTQSSRVHMQVSGLVAVVTLEQRFSNVGEVWAEGVYAFPLPEDAAVRYMEIRVGERRIVGRVGTDVVRAIPATAQDTEN